MSRLLLRFQPGGGFCHALYVGPVTNECRGLRLLAARWLGRFALSLKSGVSEGSLNILAFGNLLDLTLRPQSEALSYCHTKVSSSKMPYQFGQYLSGAMPKLMLMSPMVQGM